MKLNKILMALSAMAIVGCSSEDFNDPSVAQAIDDSRLIQLDDNFVLAGVGEVGSITRTHWEQDATTKNLVNKFLPIYSTDPAAVLTANAPLDGAVDLEAQAVGLCWLGNGGVGTDVYTNYEFYHFGWLKENETKAEIECEKLANGVLYNEIKLAAAATGLAGKEAVETNFTLPNAPVDKSGWTLNYNSGVYKTENKAIFGGQYIVYYPYNPSFKDAGTIPAKAQTLFTWDATPTTGDTYQSAWLGAATFRYSAPVTIEGGDKAADFGLKNLSTLVRLRVSTVTSDANIGDAIDQIVLYSESGKLLKQANLAADKIAAGKEGAELYAETEGTKTITTNFITTVPTLNVKTATKVSAYITVLPTTVDDLVALVHNSTDGTWAKVEMPTTEFKAGNAQVLDITVTADDFKSDYIAVDQASLENALVEADKALTIALGSDANATATISVIGDITMSADLAINNGTSITIGTNPAYTLLHIDKITIKGDDIIVPEDKALTLNTTMESDVRVLGKSCCSGLAGGRLVVAGGTVNNITMEPTEAKVTPATYDTYNPQITYSAAAEIAADKTFDVQAGNVIVDAAVQQHKGNIKIAEGAKVTVSTTGSLSFLGSTVDNYGTIEVKKAGQFYMKNANGTAVWTDGQTMTNHETGKFIHNVDAVVGTAVQFMNQNGEYRCRVDKQKALDDAYTQWTACNVIEMVSPTPAAAVSYDLAKACQHKHKGVDKYIDIEVNNTGYKTTFNDTPSDGLNIQIGNLTVKSELDVDYKQKSATDKTQRQLTVNGDMTVSANATLTESKKVTVTGDLAIDNHARLTYKGANKIVEGLKVNGDITVTDAIFDASADDAILIECTNFSLINKDATYTLTAATFGNRLSGNTNKSMTVKGTISNGKGCTFTISPAAGANLLAWITCYKVEGEGTFAGTPSVIQPE